MPISSIAPHSNSPSITTGQHTSNTVDHNIQRSQQEKRNDDLSILTKTVKQSIDKFNAENNPHSRENNMTFIRKLKSVSTDPQQEIRRYRRDLCTPNPDGSYKVRACDPNNASGPSCNIL